MKPHYLICTRCYKRWNVSRLRDGRPYVFPHCAKKRRLRDGSPTSGREKRYTPTLSGRK